MGDREIRSDGPPGLGTDEWHRMRRDVDDSNRAREKYIPMIERTVAQVDGIFANVERLTVAIETLTATLIPMATERRIALGLLKVWSGIWIGIGGSVTGGVLVWWITRRLMS